MLSNCLLVLFLVVLLFVSISGFILFCYFYIQYQNEKILKELNSLTDINRYGNNNNFLLIENFINRTCNIFIITGFQKWNKEEENASNKKVTYSNIKGIEEIRSFIENYYSTDLIALDKNSLKELRFDNIFFKCGIIFFPNFFIFDIKKFLGFIFDSDLRNHVIWLVEYQNDEILVDVYQHTNKSTTKSNVFNVYKDENGLMKRLLFFLINEYGIKKL